MRIRRFIAASLFLLLLALHATAWRGSVRVNESATRLTFEDGVARVSLVVENLTGRQIKSHIKLDLVDSYGAALAGGQFEQLLPPGASTAVCRLILNVSTLSKDDQERMLWYRLRYSISSAGAPVDEKPSAIGTISISQITRDFFDLSVVTPAIAEQGTRYHVRVRAAHPVSSQPIEGVTVQAEITSDQPGLTQSKASAVTDEHGYAGFDFDLPRCENQCEIGLKVVGSRAGLIKEVEREIRLDRAIRIGVTTDKPIYQPGQTLHIRALALDPGRRAVPEKELTLKLEDPENTLLYRAVLKTSRFGIASADWPIPGNARLGDYEIRLHIDEEDEEGVFSPPIRVKISRYELPNFTVSVKSDRRFYLPGENAEVEVRGDYLFGQPVARGLVRVVGETSRNWNYREQKWETEEQARYEGELDKNGRFIARVDLTKEHAELEKNYDRIRDVTFAAYLTDATTGRTEQRRFDLRVTREPIQVYVIEGRRGVSTGDAVSFYVSTSYADGEPAACDVKISQDINKRDYALRTVRANRYGLAKVSALNLAIDRPDASLSFVANDGRGRVGHETASIEYWSKSAIRIETNKTLYRAGQPIEVTIAASQGRSSVFVDVARNWKLFRSQEVRLTNGKARFTLPYADDFKDEVTIAAYSHTDPQHDSFEVAARTVLYPRDHELKLDVRMSRAEYRPGAEAVADLRVRTADGKAVESALGVSVTDRAVDERARTDTESGSRGSFYRSFRRLWTDGESLGGVKRTFLDQLDMSKPVPADLDLVAEVLLRSRSGYWPEEFGGDGYASSVKNLFYLATEGQLKPVKAALATRYARTGEYPRNAATLRREMNEFGISFDQMTDPWGVPYNARFSTQQTKDVLEIDSAGPDKRLGTADDFTAARLDWPYFKEKGQAIDRAVSEYHRRTGRYIRNPATLKRELGLQGINIDLLRDRWGKPYRVSFEVARTSYLVNVRSGGENSRFEHGLKRPSDDFTLWSSSIDYSVDVRIRLNMALNNYFNATGKFPENDEQFDDALSRADMARDSLRDPWGRRYYATFKTQSRYGDHVKVYSYAQYNETPKQKTEITPVTQQVNFIYIRSTGEDAREGTEDDFDLASFSRIVAERARPGAEAQLIALQRPLAGGSGSITGVVVDSQGAAIAGAKVKAQTSESAQEYETKSDTDGGYLIAGLAPGTYLVRFEAQGFSTLVIEAVPVQSSSATEVNGTLTPSGQTEMVMVTAGAAEVQTMSMSASQIVELPVLGRRFQVVTRAGGEELSTPRLREYFPETLLWRPSIETDAAGLAQLKFKLADNITTWKMLVTASTLDGEISSVEQDIIAFQPFFIEHDPPRVLTEGDRIELPVILQNYLDKPQSVALEIKPAAWFKLLGPSKTQTAVAAGDTAREVFEFQAVSSVKDAGQRITASGAEASDAIEKPVSVHPDGEEVTGTASQVIRDTATIEVAVPSNAIPETTVAELKLYPNLMAHVLESVEAIMQRPYGCAEQTISASYPSLLVLRSRKAGAEVPAAIVQRAERYVRTGYERLLGYRDDNGAFSYWGRGAADLALTAYAVRFLSAASEVVPIDEGVIREAREWLVKHQRADGSWPEFDWKHNEDRKRTALLTAYITRVLSEAPQNAGDNREALTARQAAALKRALEYLSQRVNEIDEPYLIASYALSAAGGGNASAAASAAAKLGTLARSENGASYWSLETNTPFYGWGLAGRIETTALAVQALNAVARLAKPDASRVSDDPGTTLIDSGLLFLLQKKDRYGVWYSTQATVNVLEALMTVLERREPASATNRPAEIFVNGQRAASIEMPASHELANPISINLSRFMSPGTNRIEIRRAPGSPQASAQIVTSHWETWAAVPASAEPASLRLRVSYDKTESRIGEAITCTVEAERVGFKGYGMMLAEIGLPPGASVDRASLETAMKESDWTLQQYDVLPDRLIVYLWPKAGGSRFKFKFTPRYGMAAQTEPSALYDYYNPEARVITRPVHFVVK